MSGETSDRPPYSVIARLDTNIEIRKYPSLKWACTSLNGNTRYDYKNNMFMNLFNYISGQNDSRIKISMTAPGKSLKKEENKFLLKHSFYLNLVTTEYLNQNNEPVHSNSNCQISMKFYVPQSNQLNTPNPNGGQVYIQKEPEMTVAVIKFGGFASMNDYIHYRYIFSNTFFIFTDAKIMKNYKLIFSIIESCSQLRLG